MGMRLRDVSQVLPSLATGALRTFARRGVVSAGRALLLGLLSPVAKVPLLVMQLLAMALTLIGIGAFLTPLVVIAVRDLADLHRRLAREWSAVDIPRPYRPLPPGVRIGNGRQFSHVMRDPATWRDLLWLAASTPVAVILGIVPATLIVYGVEGLTLFPVFVHVFVEPWGYAATWPLNDIVDLMLVAPQGAAILAFGLLVSPWVLWAQARFNRILLQPTNKAELALRVSQLTRTRTQVVDSQAAELRRIERDLHDGAQARIVALSMSLGMAEDLVRHNPEAAQALIAEAREASGKALAELRDLVRGIHPPVLAERGLDGGIRALALTLPLPVAVEISLPGRPDAPVESAAYFAVAEALTNVVKHSGATRAWVGLDHRGDRMRIIVGDDGTGGADLRAGTGLPGIERRLAAFDGTLHVDSPAGGPTVLTMELPCVLSSPKTSPSSGTG